MCGRYQCWIEDEDLTSIIEREKKGNSERYLRRQEIYPGEDIAVLYGGGYFLRSKIVSWGYPMEPNLTDIAEGREKKYRKLILHARAETVMEKRMFRDGIANRRIAIPASGYYEWGEQREKYRIQKEHCSTLYLAGITLTCGEKECAVILTIPASLAIQHIHPRMPLILAGHEVEDWLYNDYFCRHKLQDPGSCLLDAVPTD